VIYGDHSVLKKVDVVDVDFWVEQLIKLPSFRPFKLYQIVNLIKSYCNNFEFKEKLILKSIIECPVVIYRLYKLNVIKFHEIEPHLNQEKAFIACFYFQKHIEEFDSIIRLKSKKNQYIASLISTNDPIDLMIEYGFAPSTIEYCLKYDDIGTFQNLFTDLKSYKLQETKWSPFEWSRMPPSNNLLQFSSLFGSIKCFKMLLLNGFIINDDVLRCSACSGNFDLIHLCLESSNNPSVIIASASEFYHMKILRFLIEKGGDINYVNEGLMGGSALHLAAEYGHHSIVEYLVKNGANPNILDNNFILKFFILHLFIRRQNQVI